MGGTSSSGAETTNQVQHTEPYWQAQRPLDTILGQVSALPAAGPTGTQNNAFNNLVALGQAGNPYAGGISNVANSLLSGGPDRTGIGLAGYGQFQDQMGPTARGDYLDPNKNPYFGATTSAISNNVRDQLNQTIAGSGRGDPAGYGSFGGVLGEKISNALAPYFMNQYNQERTNQLGAQQGLYNAGNQTSGLLSGLDTQRFANQQAGIGAAGAAMDANLWGPQQVITAEAARLGITPQQLQERMGIVAPAAKAFGTTSSTGTTDKETETDPNWGQLGVGAGTAAALFF